MIDVIVTVEVQFVVRVDTDSPVQAEDYVESSWNTVYKHRAKLRGGIAPQLQGGKVISTKAITV